MPSKRNIVISGARRKGAVEKASARSIVIQGGVGVGKTTLAMGAPIEARFSNVVAFSGPEVQTEDLVKMKRVVPTFHRVAPAIVVDDADCIPNHMKDAFAETVKSINYRVPIILVATSANIPESDRGKLARELSGNIVVSLFPCNAREAEALLTSHLATTQIAASSSDSPLALQQQQQQFVRKLAFACKGDIRHAQAQLQMGPTMMPDKDGGGGWGARAAATAALSGKRAQADLDTVVTNLACRVGASQNALGMAHDLLFASDDGMEISARLADVSSMLDTFEHHIDPMVSARITALELRRHPLRPVVSSSTSSASSSAPNTASSVTATTTTTSTKRAKPDGGFGAAPASPTLHGLEVAKDVHASESKRARIGWSPHEVPGALAFGCGKE